MLSQLNWIDLCGAVLLVRLGYMGIRQGLGVELVKLTGLVTGLFVGLRWYQGLGEWIAARTVLTPEWAGALVLLGLVMVPYLLVGVACRLIQKVVTWRFAPAVDTVGGAAASIVRASLIISVILVTLQQLPSEYLRVSIDERSLSGRYLARVAPAVYQAVTPFLARHLPASITQAIP